MTGGNLVERVDERRGTKRSEHAFERSCECDFAEERHAAAGIAGNRGPIAQDEPPAFIARFFGDVCEQARGLIIAQPYEGELLVSVEPDDDTRPPTAEPSSSGVEKHWAREALGARIVRVRVLCHSARSLRRCRLQSRALGCSACGRSQSRRCAGSR